MEITWQVDDGYAGPSRPQHVEVPDEELDECESEEERMELIEGYVQDEFENNIPSIGSRREPEM